MNLREIYGEIWASVLAANLAVAAALCRSWALGNDVDCAFQNNWEPGCRRDAPGVEVY